MFTVEERARIRDRLLDRADRDPRVTGVAVTGSAAAAAEDRWSDIDLLLAIDPAADLRAVISDWTTWLDAGLGAVGRFDLVAAGTTYRAVLLSSGLEVDLGFAPGEAFRRAGGQPFTLLRGRPAEDLPAEPLDTGHLTGLAWHHVLTLACARHDLPTAHGKGFDSLPTTVTGPARATLPRSTDRADLVAALWAATGLLLAELRELGTGPDLQATLRELADVSV